MKLHHLLEEVDPQIKEMLQIFKKANVRLDTDADGGDASAFLATESGVAYRGITLQMRFEKVGDKIPYQFNKVVRLEILGRLKSVDNMPKDCGTISLTAGSENHSIEHFDTKGNKLIHLEVWGSDSLKKITSPGLKSVTASECTELELDAIPDSVTKICLINCPKITSYTGAHKKFLHLDSITLDDKVKSGLIDLLRIESLKSIKKSGGPIWKEDDGVSMAIDIVAKYVGQGLKGIVKAQRELLENDFEDFE